MGIIKLRKSIKKTFELNCYNKNNIMIEGLLADKKKKGEKKEGKKRKKR
jgi:hypothetical protein